MKYTKTTIPEFITGGKKVDTDLELYTYIEGKGISTGAGIFESEVDGEIKTAFQQFFREENKSTNNISFFILSEFHYPTHNGVEIVLKKINERLDAGRNVTVFIITGQEPRPIDCSYFFNAIINETEVKPYNIFYNSSVIDSRNYENKGANILISPLSGTYFVFHGSEEFKSKITNFDFNVVNKTKLFNHFTRRVNLSRWVSAAVLHSNFDKDEFNMSLGVDNEIKDAELEFYNRLSTAAGADFYFKDEIPIVYDRNYVDSKKNEQYMHPDSNNTSALFDIVHETNGSNVNMSILTRVFNDFYYCSEKSFRPYTLCSIPIYFNSVGFINWFSNQYQLDTFDDILPNKLLDRENDFFKKTAIVKDFLLDFKKNNTDYNEVLKSLKPRMEYNMRRLPELFRKAQIEKFNNVKESIYKVLNG